MIIYQASPPMSLVEAFYNTFHEQLNVLLSVAYMNDFNDIARIYRHMVASLIGDSGAFSVAMGKSKLTLQKDIAFFKAWGHMFDHYFNFDSDFSNDSFDNNLENFQKMRDAGLNPVPVIHNFYNHEIEYYLEHFDCPWLALGSAQSTSFPDIEYSVYKIKKARPDTKIHLFGRCNYEWFLSLPIDACDITSAIQLAGFGFINFWNEENKKVNKTDKIYIGGRIRDLDENEHHFITYKQKTQLETYLKVTFGLTFHDLLDSPANLQLINVRYYTDLQKRINEYRAKSKSEKK